MIRKRDRFFLAVEGQSERSFATWLGQLAGESLHIHLDTYILNGGGYQAMLREAVWQLKKGLARGVYQNRFLIVDSDRSETGDWPIETLRQRAAEWGIIVCLQRPNMEGVLLRMISGYEKRTFDAATAARQLAVVWESYRKPPNAQALRRRFALEDLLRMACFDEDFQRLLRIIGLVN